ncbi:MAG: hypothetical protein QOE53_911, partial [Pseudonocardiales bacterium]|nr:hypothetical protein [Pseudonocardiales bacterium]
MSEDHPGCIELPEPFDPARDNRKIFGMLVL